MNEILRLQSEVLGEKKKKKEDRGKAKAHRNQSDLPGAKDWNNLSN